MRYLNWFKSSDQRVLDLQAEVEALQRKLSVAEAEIDSMAAVIARDRARVEAETAIFNRRRAIAEQGSTTDDDGLDESIRRFTA